MNMVLILNILATIIHTIPEVRNKDDTDAAFDTIELVCTILFTLEYLMAFVAAIARPIYNYNPLRFAFSVGPLIQLLCLLPYWLKLILDVANVDTYEIHVILEAMVIIRCL